MTKAKNAAIFGLLVGFLCLLLPSAAAAADDAKQLVTIGVIAPLTGGLAARGQDTTRLLEIIEPEFNRRSKQYRYKFVIDDGMCGLGNTSTTLAQKFINVDKVKFLITHCSGETLQAGPVAQRAGVVTMAVLSTHQDVKKLGNYVFRTFVDIERGVENFAAHMKQRSGKIALLTEENAFTFGIKELLERYLPGDIVLDETFASGLGDFRTLLTKIRASGAKGVYFNVLSESTLAVLVNQSRDLGLDIDFYSYNMPEASSFVKLTGPNSEQLEFIGSPSILDTSPDFQRAYKRYMELHPEGPSYYFILQTLYDAADIIVRAVEAVGPEPQKARDFIARYHGKGALGEIAFDENGDVANLNYVLKRIEKGEVKVVGQLVQAGGEGMLR